MKYFLQKSVEINFLKYKNNDVENKQNETADAVVKERKRRETGKQAGFSFLCPQLQLKGGESRR
jgi:hypothetical protein